LILISNRNISFSTVCFAGLHPFLAGRQPAFVRRLAPHKKSLPILLKLSVEYQYGISLPFPIIPGKDLLVHAVSVKDRRL
jgi:hypothetical protein